MKAFLEFLSGKKTYLVALAGIVYAALAYHWGFMDAQGAGELILACLGASGLRNGITQSLVQLLLAQGVNVPAKASFSTVKAAVAAHAQEKSKLIANGVAKIAPVLVVIAVIGLGGGLLSACSTVGTFFDNPANDLQLAEEGFSAAQALYNTVCASNADAAFCSASNMKTANDAATAARNAIAAAQTVLANSGSTDAQIAAAIQGAQTAIRDFTNIVDDLQAAKAKAMQAKAAARVSMWDRFRGWATSFWRA